MEGVESNTANSTIKFKMEGETEADKKEKGTSRDEWSFYGKMTALCL